MSSLGQISSRLDRNLQLVGDLTKALLTLRAELTGKLDALKLLPADVAMARTTVVGFLNELIPVLKTKTATSEEHRVILNNLSQGEEPLSDWAEDFGVMIDRLRANTPLESEQLDKIMRVVAYLQGEAAEDVRRLRSR